ncbi:MAG: SpoIIIAH-like family protein [Lachnospiraceae bacterium]|nr:SpoIIIAH-like family protein [Lachnospiraceae bacterium]
MKNVFKKNQIIITTLALMIVVAGYVSYTNGNLKDKDVARETSADAMEEEYEISDEDLALEGDVFTDIEDDSTETSVAAGAEIAEVPQGSDTGIDNPGEAVFTSSDASNVNFAVEMKLNREQVRSQNKETLLGVINNESLTETQKQAAVDQMIAMTDIAEREAAAEMLLEAKGFTDVVVSITDNSADVVLNMGEVTDAKRAQVEDIVKRKTNVAAENIIITPIQTTEQGTENLTEQATTKNAETTEEVESTMSTEAEILED